MESPLPCYVFPLFSVIVFVSKYLRDRPCIAKLTSKGSYQGVDAVIRVVRRLEDQLEDARSQLVSRPESLIALLRKELHSIKRTLAQKNDALIKERQFNHQLRRRVHELEREIASSALHIETASLPRASLSRQAASLSLR